MATHSVILAWKIPWTEEPGRLWCMVWQRIYLSVQEMQETSVRPLGQEDPLKYEVATHSSVLAWKIPWTEEPGVLQSTELQRVGHD